jgi:hypothetical protein
MKKNGNTQAGDVSFIKIKQTMLISLKGLLMDEWKLRQQRDCITAV